MRTLPAILLTAFVALVIIASAVLTTQFGVRDWPTPPGPDTATRLVTPTEAAGRATDNVTSHQPGLERRGPTAYSGSRRESRSRAERRSNRGASTRRRDSVPRNGGASTPQRDGGIRGDRPAEPTTGGDEPTLPDEGVDPVPAPETPLPSEPVTPAAPIADSGADAPQARPQEQLAPPAPPVTPGDDPDEGEGNRGPGRNEPIRNLLQQLLPRP